LKTISMQNIPYIIKFWNSSAKNFN